MEIEEENTTIEPELVEPELVEPDLIYEDNDFIIGDETEPSEEEIAVQQVEQMPHIKEFRKAFKENAKRLKELEAENALLKQPITNAHNIQVVEEPTLESCGYDPDEYKSSLKLWFDNEAANKQHLIEQENLVKRAQDEWANLTKKYNAEKAVLKVKNYDDVESDFITAIHPEKQGDLLKYAKEPAKLIYALGKDPVKLKILQDIDNKVDFVLKVKEYEEQMKTVKRSGVPLPEKSVIGGGLGSVVHNDAKLKQLEIEADQTGNRTKLVAYRRSLKG